MKITNMQIKNKLIKMIIGALMMNILTSCQAMPRIEYEAGILDNLFEKAGKDKNKMLNVFCDEAKTTKGKEFDSLVTSTYLNYIRSVNEQKSWGLFANAVDVSKAINCLFEYKLNGKDYTQGTIYQLMLIAKIANGREEEKLMIYISAKDGHPQSQYWLAEGVEICVRGVESHNWVNVLKEKKEDVTLENYYHWLLKAAEGGLPIAQLEVGKMHFSQEQNILKPKYKFTSEEGIKWLEKAYASKNTEYPENVLKEIKVKAANEIAVFYSTSEKYYNVDVEPITDYTKAWSWINKLRDDEINGRLAFRLSEIYRHGLGVEKDEEKAKAYLIRGTPKIPDERGMIPTSPRSK